MTRKYTVDASNPKSIKLLVNDVHMSTVFYADDSRGAGWRVLSNSPNWPRTRKVWPSAYDAARSAFGSDTAKMFADR